jgi:predicted SprT family Zn-dependent metalloprotease
MLSVRASSVPAMDLRDAYRMATELLDRHGLEGWSVEFDGAKRRAGICRYGPRLIGLSAPLARLHSREEVRDTVLHEIAHALVGARHGHDAVWAAQARAIGGTAERCLPQDAPTVTAPWLGVCPAGHTQERHRRPERVQACGLCSSSFSVEHLLEWTHHGRPGVMHPNYDLELEQLRSGSRLRLAGVGGRVRLLVPGALHGEVGTVVKVGRTSYHVRLARGTFRVLFAAAEPVLPGVERAARSPT